MSFEIHQWPPKDHAVVGGEWIRWRSRLFGRDAKDQRLPIERGSAFTVKQVASLLGVETQRFSETRYQTVEAMINQRALEIGDTFDAGKPLIGAARLEGTSNQPCVDMLTTFAVLSRVRGSVLVFGSTLNWHFILNPYYFKGGVGPLAFSWEWNVAVWKGKAA